MKIVKYLKKKYKFQVILECEVLKDRYSIKQLWIHSPQNVEYTPQNGDTLNTLAKKVNFINYLRIIWYPKLANPSNLLARKHLLYFKFHRIHIRILTGPSIIRIIKNYTKIVKINK